MSQNGNKQFKTEEIKSFKMSNQILYCVLSYIYVLWIVGLLAEKDNPTVKFHVNQGIILSAVSFFSI